jgi:gamma-glutamylcyclotransferase (GGCT)/AIG2-like uncharacterized protein YtfP
VTLYFAYGSNMDPVQMAVRCPTSRALGTASLADHRLTFVRDSPAWGGGVGSVEPAEGEVVWGVLWELTPEDEAALDAYESVEAEVYRKASVEVITPEGPVEAMLYVVVDPEPKVPSAKYLRALIRGATSFGVPDDYVEQLRARSDRPPGAR